MQRMEEAPKFESDDNGGKKENPENNGKVVVVEQVGSGSRTPEERDKKAEELRGINEDKDRHNGRNNGGTFGFEGASSGVKRDSSINGVERETKKEEKNAQGAEEKKETAPIDPSKSLAVKEKIDAATEFETKRRAHVEQLRREKYGIKDPNSVETLKVVYKGFINTLGSVFGARAAWEIPKAWKEGRSKKKEKNTLTDTVISLLEEAQNGKQKERQEGNESEKNGKVTEKIRLLNERLKTSEMPPDEKKRMRGELAGILLEYRKQNKDLEKAKKYRLGELFDIYINNSAQRIVAAREVFNTISIITFMPWLRAAGYSMFAIAERARKASIAYDKENFGKRMEGGSKLAALAKDLTVNAARETARGLTFGIFDKEKKGAMRRTGEFASSLFMLMRAAGLAEYEYAIQSGSMKMEEGAQKLFDHLSEMTRSSTINPMEHAEAALGQGAINWVENSKRVLTHFMRIANPSEEARKLMEDAKRELGDFTNSGGSPRETVELPGHEQIPQNAAPATFELSADRLRELATVGKGEGIEHSLIRQLEARPDAFGYNGGAGNALELHRWAQSEAHRLAIKNNFIDAASGSETRVYYNAENPSSYILKPDGSIEAVNAREYTQNAASELQKAFEKSFEYMEDDRQSDVMSEEIIYAGGSTTPEDVESQKAFLESFGVARADTDKLSYDEFLNKTPEEVRTIIAENDAQIAEQQHQEESIGINAAEELSKMEGVKYVGDEGTFTADFNYDADGNVTAVYENGKTNVGGNIALRELVLKYDWRDRILDSMKGQERLAAMRGIETSAAQLGISKKIMEEMQSSGKTGTKEYDFLKKLYESKIKSAENKYGDIYK